MVVARNVYRIRTSGFRSVRAVLPILLAAPMLLAIFYVVPWIAEQLVDEIETFFASEVSVIFLQVIFLTLFVMFVTFPITFALNSSQEEHYEILLSAPIEAKDVLLGRFLGDMPFYAVGISAIAAVIAGLLVPLGLSLMQGAAIIAVVIFTYLSALWIGVDTAALIRTKIGASSHGKDIGKAFSMVIALPLVAVMYSIMGGGLYEALLDADSGGVVPLAVSLLPSSWGAEIVVSFASNPGDVSAISAGSILGFVGVTLFFIGSLWFGTKTAQRAYNLETLTTSHHIARRERSFYRVVRRLSGGGSFSSLVVALFKDYGRRLENTSKVIYVVGLVFLVTIFFSGGEEVEMSAVMLLFILPILSGFIIGEVTVRGKENLFIYRKAPGGESRLVRARLVQSSITILPFAVLSALISLINVSSVDPIATVAFVFYIAVLSVALAILSLGMFLMMPVFSERQADMMGNVMIGCFFMMGCFILTVMLGLFGEVEGWLLILGLTSIAALLVLQMGYRNLKRME